MSKYNAGQLNVAALCIDGKKIDVDHGGLVAELDGTVVADMLREYATHLAAQAEWPSEEDVERAAETHMRVRGLGMLDPWQMMTEETRIGYRRAMRAALQSVRPPAGVVSDDRAALLYLMQQFDAETWECPNCGHSEDTATMDSAYYLREYLASRHAPTKE